MSVNFSNMATYYGNSGQKTVETMREAVSKENMDLSFDSKKEVFTIINSRGYSEWFVRTVFEKYKYEGWRPILDKQTDQNGDYKVILKRINSSNYTVGLGSVLHNDDLTFHGIGYDIGKFQSILRHGILSKNSAKAKGVSFATTFGSKTEGGYNGYDYISVCRSPNHLESAGYKGGAFGTFVKSEIAFIIESVKVVAADKDSKMNSGIDGECFVGGSIPVSDIRGIMLPEEKFYAPLSEIDFLPGGGLGTMHLRCQGLYQVVSEMTGCQDEALLSSIQKPLSSWEEKGEYSKKITQFVAAAFATTGKKTLKEVILPMVPEEMKLYNALGHEISKKS